MTLVLNTRPDSHLTGTDGKSCSLKVGTDHSHIAKVYNMLTFGVFGGRAGGWWVFLVELFLLVWFWFSVFLFWVFVLQEKDLAVYPYLFHSKTIIFILSRNLVSSQPLGKLW